MSAVKQLFDIANTLAGENVSKNYEPTFTGAFDALTDTLAGYDVERGRTISEAIKAAAPYISGGSGGGDEQEVEFALHVRRYDGAVIGLNHESQSLRYLNVDEVPPDVYIELNGVVHEEPIGFFYEASAIPGRVIDFGPLMNLPIYGGGVTTWLDTVEMVFFRSKEEALSGALPVHQSITIRSGFDSTSSKVVFVLPSDLYTMIFMKYSQKTS